MLPWDREHKLVFTQSSWEKEKQHVKQPTPLAHAVPLLKAIMTSVVTVSMRGENGCQLERLGLVLYSGKMGGTFHVPSEL